MVILILIVGSFLLIRRNRMLNSPKKGKEI
jgi:hypothetical protein